MEGVAMKDKLSLGETLVDWGSGFNACPLPSLRPPLLPATK